MIDIWFAHMIMKYMYVIFLTFGNILLFIFTEAEKNEDSEIHRDIVSHRLKQDIVGIRLDRILLIDICSNFSKLGRIEFQSWTNKYIYFGSHDHQWQSSVNFTSYPLQLLDLFEPNNTGMMFRRSSTKFPLFPLISQKHGQLSQLLLQIDQYAKKIFSSETTVPVEIKLAGVMFRRSSTRSPHFIFIESTLPKGMFLVIFVQFINKIVIKK